MNSSSINTLRNYKTPKCIEMKGGEKPISINDFTSNIVCPYTCESFVSPKSGWSLVLIYHQNNGFKINEILNELHNVVGKSFFLPIAYTRNKFVDYFLIKNQNDALREMCKNKLQIQLKGWKLPIVVKIEVSAYAEGHIRPKKNVSMYLQRKIKETTSGILDLSRLSEEQEFVDMCFSLRNKGICRIFFDELNSIRSIKSNSEFRGLKLCNNSIGSLDEFQKLHNLKNIEILDLSGNEIMDANELVNLRSFNLKKLNIVGNCCNNYPNLEDKIQKFFPNLKQFNNKLLFNAEIAPNTECGNKEISNFSDGILVKSDNVNGLRNRIDNLIIENCWHQVILLHNKRFSEQEILDELSSNLLKDVHFYPCYYKRLDNRDEFFLCRNSNALKRLFRVGLKIQIPQNPFTIDVELRLNVAQYKEGEINWINKIKNALLLRIKNDILNLNNFPNDPTFSKMIVLMNSDATIDYVMQQAKIFNPNIKKINIEHCKIFSKSLDDNLYTFPKLKTLNIKHNSIKSLEGFKKSAYIEELYLDGNPICNQPLYEYIKHVCNHFTNLKYLDGRKLSKDNCMVSYQNYLISENLYTVAGTFVENFFNLWDSFERKTKLLNFYNENSIFTLTILYEFDESIVTMPFDKTYIRIQKIVKYSRNLLKISNMSQAGSNVYVGREKIRNVFGDFAASKHDFRVLTIDVPYFDKGEGIFLVVVTGIFEEFETSSDEIALPFSFMRSFIIKLINGNYVILNDKLVLTSPVKAQVDTLYERKKIASKSDVQELCCELLPNEREDHSLKIEMLNRLTKCSKNFCKK